MRLGFTGTQQGMTRAQRMAVRARFRGLARTYGNVTLVHGDCVGADAEAHAMARELGWATEAHPCTIASKRAHTDADVVHPPKPPLQRNSTIVRTTDALIATPKEAEMVMRSGTWSTVRRGYKRSGYPVTVVLPDGEVRRRA